MNFNEAKFSLPHLNCMKRHIFVPLHHKNNVFYYNKILQLGNTRLQWVAISPSWDRGWFFDDSFVMHPPFFVAVVQFDHHS